ncbi:MAG: hypothetical protein E6R03_00165 [Hyphomicrobiaceae bacterium]|nr:MAG: hypothetical protein E6R03_00165 [Hyphomicrobiaceae bacterium]
MTPEEHAVDLLRQVVEDGPSLPDWLYLAIANFLDAYPTVPPGVCGAGLDAMTADIPTSQPDQNGPTGFKARMAQYIATMDPALEIAFVRRWLPGTDRFRVDWREQNRRIAEGSSYDLTLHIRRTAVVHSSKNKRPTPRVGRRSHS